MSRLKANILFQFQVILVKIEDFIEEKKGCRTFVTPFITLNLGYEKKEIEKKEIDHFRLITFC